MDLLKRCWTAIDLPRTGYLRETGWLRCLREARCVDAAGLPVPWMTYAAIAFLEPRLRPDMAVFEYGSGNSTLWWAKRTARVESCEHDAAYFHDLRPRLLPNVTLRHVPLEPDGEYARSITRAGAPFDVVVIDGRDRVRCAEHARTALAADGVIVWDDSERAAYASGQRQLADLAFRRLDFWGLGPLNSYGWCTSVFYRGENCLRI